MMMGSNSPVAQELGATTLLTGLLFPVLFPTYRHPAVQPLKLCTLREPLRAMTTTGYLERLF